MYHHDFEIVSEALLLYCKYQYSLFADQIIRDTFQLPPEVIREKMKKWFQRDPMEVISILQPVKIRNQIDQTVNWICSHANYDTGVVFTSVSAEESSDNFRNLIVSYQFADTIFGGVIVASMVRGVCYLAFTDNDGMAALKTMEKRFPKATFSESSTKYQNEALLFLNDPVKSHAKVTLCLAGTAFQLQVWKRLLNVPYGGLISYAGLAGNRNDFHAFGNAVGSNPVACIIPCHRAVRSSGEFGEYHWGKGRKAAMICYENLHTLKQNGQ